jgi:hypothetical protein
MASKASSQSEHTLTLRHPPFTYLHLEVLKTLSNGAPQKQPQARSIDSVTVLSYLKAALQTYLGISGAAIVIDVLALEGQDFWLRTAYEDASAVTASISQWSEIRQGVMTQLRIRGCSTWLASITTGDESKLWTLEKP